MRLAELLVVAANGDGSSWWWWWWWEEQQPAAGQAGEDVPAGRAAPVDVQQPRHRVDVLVIVVGGGGGGSFFIFSGVKAELGQARGVPGGAGTYALSSPAPSS